VQIVRSGAMPIWAHIILLFLARIVGFFAGPVLWLFCRFKYNIRSFTCIDYFWLFGSAFAGSAISVKFVKLLPANCPKCGGPMHCEYVRRPSYECERCGYAWGSATDHA
jgi:hypothetical protein